MRPSAIFFGEFLERNRSLHARIVRKLALAPEIGRNAAVLFRHLWLGETRTLDWQRMKSDHAAMNQFQFILVCLAGGINRQ